MSLSVFYYCICDFLCCCRNFNPTLCLFSPFLLSYVTVLRPCRLSELPQTGQGTRLFIEYKGKKRLFSSPSPRDF